LTEALKDPDATVRREAAEAIGRLGPAAIPAIPAVVAALTDPDSKVRVHAAVALKDIDPADATLLRPLTAALKDPDVDVRKSAIAALRRVGSYHKAEVVAVLREVFKRKNEDQEVRVMAQGAIEEIDPSAPAP
jgi:HEAT repeat protein